MKQIDLSHALTVCAGDAVRHKIALKVGLSTSTIEEIFNRASAVLIAALAARASASRDDTVVVFGALMARDVNPRIGDECPNLVDSTGKLKELEHAGFALVARATGHDAADLSDHIAAQVGVPAQATCALTCLCAAILGGIIKHHVLIEQGDIAELPGLFANQLASIATRLDDTSIDALGHLQPDVGAFVNTLSDRLAAVTVEFAPPRPRPGEGAAGGQAAQIPPHSRYDIGKVYAHDIRFTSAMKPTSFGPAKRETPSRRRIWKTFSLTAAAALVAVLAFVEFGSVSQVSSFLAQAKNALMGADSHSNATASGVVSQGVRLSSK